MSKMHTRSRARRAKRATELGPNRLRGPKPRFIGPRLECEVLTMEEKLRVKGWTKRKIHEAIEEKLGVPRSTARDIIEKLYGPEVNMSMLPCEY